MLATSFYAIMVVAGISLHSTRRKALLAAGLGAVALSVGVWLQPERVATASTWVASLLAVAVAWLWGENLGIVVSWAQLDGQDFTRSPGLALATIAVYIGTIATIGAGTFQRRDIAAAT